MSLVRATASALIRGANGPLPKYYNAEEIHRILDATSRDKELHLIVHFLWKTGVRASEPSRCGWETLIPTTRPSGW